MATAALPVKGLHMKFPVTDNRKAYEKFISEVLPREGVNTLFLQIDYNFPFKSHPELNENQISVRDIDRFFAAAHAAGLKCIPLFSCFSQQSRDEHTFPLLRLHPEFDETPSKNNKDLYRRCWCPRSAVHSVVFDLIDEIIAATGTSDLHVGLDEVFEIGDANCPRCAGIAPAQLFADEVCRIHDHLAKRKCTMWMWGDRLLNAEAYPGIGAWEASGNHTYPAIDAIPKDIVVCDWHYEKAFDTPAYFAGKGFKVVACPWKDGALALAQLKQMRQLASDRNPAFASKALGIIQTTWRCNAGHSTDIDEFLKCCFTGASASPNAVNACACFKTLYAEIRRQA